MSLKTIELQVALPRTYDAGKQAEQIQQRSQLANDYAAHEMEKKLDQNRKNVVSLEQKEQAKLKKDFSGNRDGHSEREKKNRKSEHEKAVEDHPYKGKTIDYSG